MKSKFLAIAAVVLLAIGGTVYGITMSNDAAATKATALKDCPKAGQPDCPLIKDCELAGTPECPLVKGTASAEASALADCPKAGTPDCPLVENCPLKGTPDCPYTKDGVALASNDKNLPDCCKKH